MDIRDIPSIPGARANSLGQVKFPNTNAKMPNGGVREYKTKWVFGCKRQASKGARHKYYGTLYRGKNYKIHRLICEAFHGKQPKEKPVVIHLDESAINNRPDNLKWGTQKENLNMPKFIKYCKGRTGKNNPRVKSRKQIPINPIPPSVSR